MAEPVPAQTAPYELQVTAGRKYFWCACGLSRKQPLCDGSHAGTGLTPVMFEAAETGAVWLCGCKATRDKPYCDGSHNTL
jgi:CDGSH-type Zn-finger protein